MTAKQKIEAEAAALMRRVMDWYWRADTPVKSDIHARISKELERYNTAARKAIREAIDQEWTNMFAGEPLPKVVPDDPELSSMLHRHAKQTAAATAILLYESVKAQKSIKELAMQLYEGYGFRDKEVINITKELPRYIRRRLKLGSVQRSLQSQVNRVKTRPLRAAYQEIINALKKEDTVALGRAVKVAMEERSRYVAFRIADTETYRIRNHARAKSFLEDDQIRLVKYRMSSQHPMVDICDYFANLDIGYGKGIVPKEQMISLPLHPHCHCRYDPYYRTVKKREVLNPQKATMEQFSEHEQRRILGGWNGWKRYMEKKGSVEDVARALRPKWPITNAGKLLAHDATMHIKTMLMEVRSSRRLTANKIIVGVLADRVIRFLKDKGVAIHTKEIYLTSKGLSHLARDSKKARGAGLHDEDILKIPHILKSPDYLYFDRKKRKLNLLYCKSTDVCDDIIKVVVDTNSIDKKHKKITLIKTAGYVKESNLKGYTKIY